MNNERTNIFRSRTYKAAGTGPSVKLDDNYIAQNERLLQMQAIGQELLLQAQQHALTVRQEAEAEAERLMTDAREKALHDASSQYDSILQQAYQEGFAAGHADGINQAVLEVSDRLTTAETILDRALSGEARVIHQHGAILADLLQTVLKTVLGEELKSTPDIMARLITRAASQIPSAGAAKLIINPDTLRNLRDFAPELASQMDAMHGITFQPDANCSATEMYLDTSECIYDLSPEHQAERLLATAAPAIAQAVPADAAEALIETDAMPALESDPVAGALDA